MTDVKETAERISTELCRPIIGIENRTAREVFDIMCDRIRASRHADAQEGGDRSQPAGVRVKRLEWSPLRDYGADAEQARGTLPGLYGVFVDEDSAAGAVFAEWAAIADDFCTTSAKTLGQFSNWDEAKSAAEADYEQRIRSAFDMSPDAAPSNPVVSDEMVERAGKALAQEIRNQDTDWTEDYDEGEYLIVSPSGDYFAIDVAARAVLTAALGGSNVKG